MLNEPAYQHQFIPGRSTPRTLLLLHGTGGDETDLLPLGRALDRDASILSVRGNVLENGRNRFFRRLREGVFDEADVARRAQELADFLGAAAQRYEFDLSALVAVGYSNGANITSAMLLLGLAKFAGAILLRPMLPLAEAALSSLEDQRLFIGAGEFDPIATPENVSWLTETLRRRGADVQLHVAPAGHELTSGDVEAARDWLAGVAIA
ncbi:MAG: alpha/beta hydrolase [Verrucomicrobiota bacterium]|nr:alpha/beta hydrolase [Verrucomicrobiota bacterium]